MDFFFEHQSFQHRNAQPVLFYDFLRSFFIWSILIDKCLAFLRSRFFSFDSKEISEWILRSEWLPFVELQIASICLPRRGQAWTCQGTHIFHVSLHEKIISLSQKSFQMFMIDWALQNSKLCFHFIVLQFVPTIHQKTESSSNGLTRKRNLSNVVAHIHSIFLISFCAKIHKIFLWRYIKPVKPPFSLFPFNVNTWLFAFWQGEKFFSIYFMLCLMTWKEESKMKQLIIIGTHYSWDRTSVSSKHENIQKCLLCQADSHQTFSGTKWTW